MGFARIYSIQPDITGADVVTIETDIVNKSLNSFSIVGLPDKAVEEARDRVGAALKNSGFSSPKHTNQKTIISLAPAELKKAGAFFDVPMSISYLCASKNISLVKDTSVFVGELSLNGELQPIRGALLIAKKAKESGFTEIFLPKENIEEAGLIEGIDIFGFNNLNELTKHLSGETLIEKAPITKISRSSSNKSLDMRDIYGQETAKRGLEIAASGGHNILMFGPPGTGKTLLAKACASILPSMEKTEALEVTAIHSLAGSLKEPLMTTRPFRSPHHTASYVSVVGGGSIPKPGEVTLAHRGVLFLDEFPEFDKRVVESLRQPLEDRVVSISRSRGSKTFPANIMLVCAMNPCPCGFRDSNIKECGCSASDLYRYERKLSGPLIDRIDMWVSVEHIPYETLSNKEKTGETTEVIQNRVKKARNKQFERLSSRNKFTNSEMDTRDIDDLIHLDQKVSKLLNESAEKLSLSTRSYHRILKLAQTIADLDDSENIKDYHILEALQYRKQ